MRSRRLVGFGAAVVAVHVLGWGLVGLYAHRYPALPGLATLAYTFGVRHAFDPDHIAAIDNTTRKLRQDGGRPLGIGFFFSLGHATVVIALVAALAAAAHSVEASMAPLQTYGRYVGATLSGTFLWVIGVVNLIVLIQLARMLPEMRRGTIHRERLEQRLLHRGLVSRFVLGSRLAKRLRSSWQMYPLGLLFGLSFDTATEVGLLAVAAGAATHRVAFLAVLSLALVFAAGMSLLDTAVGAFMSETYEWVLSNPIRRAFYNLTLTGVSVAVALLVGTVELLQVAGVAGGIDPTRLGYAMVALFVVTWAVAAVVWKAARLEDRWGNSGD